MRGPSLRCRNRAASPERARSTRPGTRPVGAFCPWSRANTSSAQTKVVSEIGTARNERSLVESRLAEQQIHDPAATDVRAGTAAVREDTSISAAGVFERVGEDRQLVKVPAVVHGPGEPGDRPVIPDQEERVD